MLVHEWFWNEPPRPVDHAKSAYLRAGAQIAARHSSLRINHLPELISPRAERTRAMLQCFQTHASLPCQERRCARKCGNPTAGFLPQESSVTGRVTVEANSTARFKCRRTDNKPLHSEMMVNQMPPPRFCILHSSPPNTTSARRAQNAFRIPAMADIHGSIRFACAAAILTVFPQSCQNPRCRRERWCRAISDRAFPSTRRTPVRPAPPGRCSHP